MYTKFATNSLKAFHALYIGTWAVTAKREPLSLSLSLIITTYPLCFLLVPTHLSVSRPLSAQPRHFILGCPHCFVHSASAFYTWSLEAANTWHARSNPQENSCIIKNVHDVGLGLGWVCWMVVSVLARLILDVQFALCRMLLW